MLREITHSRTQSNSLTLTSVEFHQLGIWAIGCSIQGAFGIYCKMWVTVKFLVYAPRTGVKTDGSWHILSSHWISIRFVAYPLLSPPNSSVSGFPPHFFFQPLLSLVIFLGQVGLWMLPFPLPAVPLFTGSFSMGAHTPHLLDIGRLGAKYFVGVTSSEVAVAAIWNRNIKQTPPPNLIYNNAISNSIILFYQRERYTDTQERHGPCPKCANSLNFSHDKSNQWQTVGNGWDGDAEGLQQPDLSICIDINLTKHI